MKKFFSVLAGSFLGCCLAIFLGAFFLFGMLGTMMLSFGGNKEAVTMPESAILRIDFKAPIGEQSKDNMNLMTMVNQDTQTKSISIIDAVRAIKYAESDPRIKFLYINTDYISCGTTHLEELRNAVKDFKTSGKAVITYSNNYSQPGYYLASASDKVILNPFGSAMMYGLSSNVMLLKDFLDMVGVEMQLVRQGKFKAAGEQFTKSSMSPENEEQMKAMLTTIWNGWFNSIVADRGLDQEVFQRQVDNLELANAQHAVDARLVDELMYNDQLESYLAGLYGAEKFEDVRFIDIQDYAPLTKSLKSKKENVAIIYAEGEIKSGQSDQEIFSQTFAKMISKVRKDSSVKAVVLRVNSPGGDAQAAEIIARELRELRKVKPLVVSFGDYAASGGYWISAQSDRIFTNHSTLTGSIGVFSMIPTVEKGANEILKVHFGVVNTNKNSDVLNITRRLKDTERNMIQASTKRIYDAFLQNVATGRNLTVERVDEIAQGRVWAGGDAINIGLADEIGGICDAVEYAAKAAGLSDYGIKEYPLQKDMMTKVLEMLTSAGTSLEIISDPMKAAQNAYAEMNSYCGKVFARVPYMIEINK